AAVAEEEAETAGIVALILLHRLMCGGRGVLLRTGFIGHDLARAAQAEETQGGSALLLLQGEFIARFEGFGFALGGRLVRLDQQGGAAFGVYPVDVQAARFFLGPGRQRTPTDHQQRSNQPAHTHERTSTKNGIDRMYFWTAAPYLRPGRRRVNEKALSPLATR